jgi:hypothetical protein
MNFVNRKLLIILFATTLLFESFAGCSTITSTSPSCYEKISKNNIHDLLLHNNCKEVESKECLQMISKDILQSSASKYQNMRFYEADSIVKNSTVSTFISPVFSNFTKFSKFQIRYNTQLKLSINGIKYKDKENYFFSSSLAEWITNINSNDFTKESPLKSLCEWDKTEINRRKDRDLSISLNNPNAISLLEKSEQFMPLTGYIVGDFKLINLLPQLNSFTLKGLKSCGNEQCYIVSANNTDEDGYDSYDFWIGKESLLIYKVGNMQVSKKGNIGFYEEIHENIVFK